MHIMIFKIAPSVRLVLYSPVGLLPAYSVLVWRLEEAALLLFIGHLELVFVLSQQKPCCMRIRDLYGLLL
jgi:hypothetical protein